MAIPLPLESALRHDRVVVAVSLTVVVAIAVAYTVLGVGMPMSALTMTRMAVRMPGMAMDTMAWTAGYSLVVFLMWWVMMIAMMVPSAAPSILLYADLARKQTGENAPYMNASFFLAGYLAVWGGFSLVATLGQWGLERLGAVNGMMQIADARLAGAVLIAAGLYQVTPLKAACLKHCQHPLMFLLHHWKPGRVGALRMGAESGGYCLGCCWFLMALLFVGGIMNLLWIAGVAILVGIEKFAARSRLVPLVTGAVLTGSGIWLLALPLVVAV